jgi:hypothetical protein
LNSKILNVFEKDMVREKPKWRPKTKMASDWFFLNRNSTVMPSINFVIYILLMQICWKLDDVSKNYYLVLIEWPQNSKWRQKPMFPYFCSKNFNFQLISKTLNEVFSVVISIVFGIQFVRRWLFVYFGEVNNSFWMFWMFLKN